MIGAGRADDARTDHDHVRTTTGRHPPTLGPWRPRPPSQRPRSRRATARNVENRTPSDIRSITHLRLRHPSLRARVCPLILPNKGTLGPREGCVQSVRPVRRGAGSHRSRRAAAHERCAAPASGAIRARSAARRAPSRASTRQPRRLPAPTPRATPAGAGRRAARSAPRRASARSPCRPIQVVGDGSRRATRSPLRASRAQTETGTSRASRGDERDRGLASGASATTSTGPGGGDDEPRIVAARRGPTTVVRARGRARRRARPRLAGHGHDPAARRTRSAAPPRRPSPAARRRARAASRAAPGRGRSITRDAVERLGQRHQLAGHARAQEHVAQPLRRDAPAVTPLPASSAAAVSSAGSAHGDADGPRRPITPTGDCTSRVAAGQPTTRGEALVGERARPVVGQLVQPAGGGQQLRRARSASRGQPVSSASRSARSSSSSSIATAARRMYRARALTGTSDHSGCAPRAAAGERSRVPPARRADLGSAARAAPARRRRGS